MEPDPKQLEEVASAALPIPEEMPVMILSNCFLLPGCFLPLFIFEERYRLMVRHALKTNRMFCVGIRKRSTCDEEEILPVTTVGLIRACVKNEDGTSQLMLHGMKRIRITGWTQLQPFRLAKVEPVISLPCPQDRLEALQKEAISLLPPTPEDCCDAGKLVRQAVACIKDAELACDILSYHFVKRCSTLKALLTEPCVESRYKLLIAELSRPAGDCA